MSSASLFSSSLPQIPHAKFVGEAPRMCPVQAVAQGCHTAVAGDLVCSTFCAATMIAGVEDGSLAICRLRISDPSSIKPFIGLAGFGLCSSRRSLRRLPRASARDPSSVRDAFRKRPLIRLMKPFRHLRQCFDELVLGIVQIPNVPPRKVLSVL